MEVQGVSAVSFAKRNAVLEAQCGRLMEEKLKLKEQLLEVRGKEEEMIDKYLKVKDKYAKVQEDFGSYRIKWREEEEILRENCRQEWVAKRKLEIDLKAAKRRLTNTSVELAQKLLAKDKHFQSLLEERNGRITTLLANNEALDRLNSSRLQMEAEKQEVVIEEKILDLLQKIEVLEREKGEMEAENKKKDELIVKLEEEVKAIKGMEKMWREKFEEIDNQVSSFSGEIKALERQKSKLESDHELAKMRVQEMEKALLDIKSFWEEDKRKIEEGNCRITTLLAKNEALDKHNSMLEMEFEARMAIEAKKQEAVTEKKSLELLQKIEVLEMEKGELEAEFHKMKVDKSDEAERNSNLNKAVESAKKIVEGKMRKIAVEVEKRTLEAETKKKDELIVKLKEEVKVIKGMENISREKFEAGERKWSEEVRKNEEKCRRSEAEKRELEMDLKAALNGKMTVEAEKAIMESESKTKVLELVLRIEVLEREKKELEAEFCEAKREKSEEIKMILNEKITLMEKHTKEIMDLVLRYGILDREIQRLKAETREKDEMIKLLLPEKEDSVAKKKKMEINMSRCVVKPEKDVKLQQVHPASNVSISCTTTTQHQGPKSIDVSSAERKEGLDGDMRLKGMLGKRKVEELVYSVVNQAEMKGCKLEGLTECKLVWKNGEDMLNAFTNNDELCMRSVCALYRKYKSLGDWKNRLRLTRFRGFRPPYETRGMDLGELLTRGDPEGKLKMSLAEFERSDPRGLEDCRLIAKHHHMVLFGIYKKELDPFFMSTGDMN